MVLGSTPELGSYRFRTPFRRRFERKIHLAQAAFEEQLKKEAMSSNRRWFCEEEEEDCEEDCEEYMGSITEDGSKTRGDEDDAADDYDLCEFLERYPQHLVIEFLKRRFILLEHDPDCEFEIRDYWAQQESVELPSVKNGDTINYAMAVWSISKNKLWDIEKFRVGRRVKVPPWNPKDNPENKWTIYAAKFNNQDHTTIVPDVPPPPRIEFTPNRGRDPYLASDDDDDDDDDVFDNCY